MVTNHLKLSVGIQTWIWVLKVRLPARILVPVREKGKELTEKDVHKFYSSTDIFGMFKSGGV